VSNSHVPEVPLVEAAGYAVAPVSVQRGTPPGVFAEYAAPSMASPMLSKCSSVAVKVPARIAPTGNFMHDPAGIAGWPGIR
jgi:hypothetical protein